MDCNTKTQFLFLPGLYELLMISGRAFLPKLFHYSLTKFYRLGDCMTLKGIWFVYEQAFTDICLAVSVIHKYQTTVDYATPGEHQLWVSSVTFF